MLSFALNWQYRHIVKKKRCTIYEQLAPILIGIFNIIGYYEHFSMPLKFFCHFEADI